MDDEFALCWNNFQDNIATGFQNLFDRGDLVDVTIACDGKLLHAHKIVLAICSPYFQEMFITNPCKHPIIILRDVPYSVMCELLQFMYQGVVNVKHTELPLFMKIAQTLQVKGLTSSVSSSSSSTSQKSPSHHLHHHHHHAQHQHATSPVASSTTTASAVAAQQQQQQQQQSTTNPNTNNNNNNKNGSNENLTTTSSTSLSANAGNNGGNNNGNNSGGNGSGGANNNGTIGNGNNVTGSTASLKRTASEIFNNSIEGLSIYPRKQFKRFSIEQHSNNNSDHDINNDSMDNMNSSSDDVFLPPIPQISMIESRFDINNVKREGLFNSNNEFIGGSSVNIGSGSSSSMRNSLPPPFNFEYGMYAAAAANKSIEYPNELHMSGDYPKGIANHMDIPSVAPGERWFHGKLEFMLSQRGKPLLVHDGHTFGIQYIRKDKKYWQCNLSRKFNCKARVTTTETGEIIVTNNEHCHTEIRQHLRKDYHRNKLQQNQQHQHHQQQQHHHQEQNHNTNSNSKNNNNINESGNTDDNSKCNVSNRNNKNSDNFNENNNNWGKNKKGKE